MYMSIAQVITHEPRHLLSLPRPFTVAHLLAEFLSQKKPKTDAEQVNYPVYSTFCLSTTELKK
jgi:hypothetical protein